MVQQTRIKKIYILCKNLSYLLEYLPLFYQDNFSFIIYFKHPFCISRLVRRGLSEEREEEDVVHLTGGRRS